MFYSSEYDESFQSIISRCFRISRVVLIQNQLFYAIKLILKDRRYRHYHTGLTIQPVCGLSIQYFSMVSTIKKIVHLRVGRDSDNHFIVLHTTVSHGVRVRALRISTQVKLNRGIMTGLPLLLEV